MIARVARNLLSGCALLATAVVVPDRLPGQSRGSVVIAGVADAETGEALEGAEVVIVKLRRIARANGMGEATLTDIPRGVHRFRVRRLGYSPAEVDLAVSQDTTGAVFRLQRAATQLGTVAVQAEQLPPRMRDVEVRRRQAIGRFVAEEELERDKDMNVLSALSTRFPGLRRGYDREGRPTLVSTRGTQTCPVQMYLDDMVVESIDVDLLRTWDLAMVEYYSSNEVPVRYRTRGYGCGVILLWSKWR